jgi:hypothetical protein
LALVFDSLGYSRMLQSSGIPREQAEAHAEAARQFFRPAIETPTASLVMKREFHTMKEELHTAQQELHAMFEACALRLTVRLGGLIVIGFAFLAAMITLRH